MAQSRALRNLADDLLVANTQVKWWRAEGKADKIEHWVKRRDYLLDRWATLHQQELAEDTPDTGHTDTKTNNRVS